MPPLPTAADPSNDAGSDDLSPLAWVHDELRRTLETAHKLLRRYLRESEVQTGSDVSARDLASLRLARAQLHQGAAALSVVGLGAAGRVLGAADAALGLAIERPARMTATLLEQIEQGSFAVIDYLGRLLAGKPVSSLLLFPQARALLEAAGAERVHPADLWPHAAPAQALPPEPGIAPRAADAQSLAALEQLTLISMKAPSPLVHQRLSELCAGLANGAGDAAGRSLWQVAAAVFEAQSVGLLQPDVFTKRLASRLLAQLRGQLKGTAAAASPAAERLALDLLFFCAQSLPPDASRPAPRLAAVRASQGLADARPVDYTHSPLGRFDPALVVQARKRVAAAKESWSAVAAGDLPRLAGLVEQFSLVGDSLRRLFADGDALALELQRSAAQAQRAASAPRSALAMEVATGLLYLEAALEEPDVAGNDTVRPIARLAARIAAVRAGSAPEPMEAWMEALYARVSDRQTLGTVVQELRASLAQAEQQIDHYFRHPHERSALLSVPGLMQSMRGVLSVLGVDQASQALQQMREEVEALAAGDQGPLAEPLPARFERLAGNLGALGFLIDMLGVQPVLARSLFHFDPDTGVLSPVMGRAADAPPLRAAGVPVLQDVITVRPEAVQGDATASRRPAEPLAPAPVPAPGPAVVDADMRAVFIEEAAEVLQAARVALADWHAAPRESEPVVRLRRAFHTLKGSARMVGLTEFGDAAWSWEQAYNARLAENPPQHDRVGHEAQGQSDATLRARTGVALDQWRRWVERLASGPQEPIVGETSVIVQPTGPVPSAPPPPQAPPTQALPTQAPPPPLPTLRPLPTFAAPPPVPASPVVPVMAAMHDTDTRPGVMLTSLPGDRQDPLADLATHGFAAFPSTEQSSALAASLPDINLDFDLPLDDGLPGEPAVDLDLDLDPAPDAAWASEAASGFAAPPVAPPLGLPPGLPSADDLDLSDPLSPLRTGEAAGVEDIGRPIEPAAMPAVDLSFLSLDLSEPKPVAPPVALPPPPPTPAPFPPEEPALAAAATESPAALETADAPDEPADGTAATVHEVDLDDDPSLRALFDGLGGDDITGPDDPVQEPLPEPSPVPTAAADDWAGEPGTDRPPEPQALDGADVTELDGLPDDVVETAPGVLESIGAPENTKVVGPLRIPIPLFNVYLNEADERSRRLSTALAEWALERHLPLPDAAVEHAHSLAGNSATVGYTALSDLARALEQALVRVQALGRRGVPGHEDDARLFSDVADELRRLLHQFAAGFLKLPAPELLERLAAHERDTESRLQASQAVADAAGLEAADWLAGIEAEDQVDADLFPIFEEEAQDLLPRLAAALRDWMQRPNDLAAADAGMRHLHTFKGGARLAGAMRLGELAHRLETRIERLATGGVAVRPIDVESLLAGSDALQQAFETLRERDATAYAEAEAHALAAVPLPLQDVAPLDAAVDASVGASTDATSVDEPQGAPLGVPVDVLGDAGRLSWDEAPAPSVDAPSEPEPVDPHAVEPQHPEPDLVAAPAAPKPAPAAIAPEDTAGIDWGRFADPPPLVAPAERTTAPAASTVRVRAGLLERLVNQAGEVNLSRARMEVEVGQVRSAVADLTDNLERLRQQLHDIELQAEMQMSSRIEATKAAAQAFDPLEIDRFTRFQELTRMMAESVNDVATVQRTLKRTLERAEDELAAQSRLTRELQADLLRTRMVEFDTLGERLHRVVRQAAKETGKQVRLDIVGGAIELDRGMLDRLTPAFEHLLRNAVIHGIEPPAARQAAGKSPIGGVMLSLNQHGNEVGIELRDDGAGLDRERIRAKAAALGLAVPPGPGEPEAELIFSPGFSTADRLTELAGRGVGLDVVRTEVMAVGGRVTVSSPPGQGTCFTLALPLTTAVTQVLMLRCGELAVAVPATLVERVRRITPEDLAASRDSGSHRYGEQALPFYWLGALLQHSAQSAEPPARSGPVVVLRSAQRRIALHVDEVLGHQEAVVKPLGPQLSQLPGLAGMSLLASGRIALIYNPLVLASVYGDAAQALSRAAAAGSPLPAGLSAAAGAVRPAGTAPDVPLVLVVDDSLTVRRVTQRLLVREGYRVQLAKDGLEALERAAEECPAVVLSDIEMPRMDGFELVRALRADSRFERLPVVIISSRTASKHREFAATLGVDHYLGKPYGEEELLGVVRRLLPVVGAAP